MVSATLSFSQISVKYPNDAGIEKDPDVLYVEKFNDGLNNILGRYDEIVNSGGMTLDRDIPSGSREPYSLRITSIPGENMGGHLYKSFRPGFDNTVYLRYYVKHPSIPRGYYGHQGLWFGGYNPVLDFPYPRAGICGLGSSRISIAFENVWRSGPRPGMDAYIYWGDMKSYDEGATCFGNTMITEGRRDYQQAPAPDAPLCDFDEWMCIEIMIRLNDPVTAYNGELRIWKNGTELGHWGPGFPNGHWLKDKWYNNPADPPFEGFRWRTDENLNINWIWIEFWHNSDGPSSHIKFSNIVMAREYIGPIYDPAAALPEIPGKSKNIKVSPNPGSGTINISNIEKICKTSVFNVLGKKVMETESDTGIDVSYLNPGIYFLNIETENDQYKVRIVKN